MKVEKHRENTFMSELCNNADSRLSALMAAQGASLFLKAAVCPDAIWISHAKKTVSDYWSLNITACLFQYKEGYHLDMYGIFTKRMGGIDIAKTLGKAMANAAIGTPEQWTEKVFLDVVRNIHKATNANISFLEGYPPVSGTPWLDTLDTGGNAAFNLNP